MTHGTFKRIAATCPPEFYLGREDELNDVVNTGIEGAFVGSAPGDGASELLRQAYDRMFFAGGSTVPFYFPFKGSNESLIETARRFVYQLVVQTTAFRHGDPNIIRILPTLSEIESIATAEDLVWIEPLLKLYGADVDQDVFVNTCFSAPFRAIAVGMELVVFIDDIHFSMQTAKHISELYHGAGIRSVFGGRRRYDLRLNSSKRVILEPFDGKKGAEFVRSLSKRSGIKVTDSTVDLIAEQLYGNVRDIEAIFAAAHAGSVDLESYRNFGSIYVDEIFRGSIARNYDSLIRSDDESNGSDAIKFLYELYEYPSESQSIEFWRKKMSLGKKAFEQLSQHLYKNELIDLQHGRIMPIEDRVVLSDQIRLRYRMEIEGERESIVFTDAISHQLKRAPKFMSRVYRRNASLGLKEILSKFDSQIIPLALMDYGRFKSEYQGLSDREMADKLKADNQTIKLPQIVFSTYTEDIYSQIAKISLKERSAAGIGFYGGTFEEENEIVWIAAEVDSKLEASRELTEFWCDRLEMAALMGNYVSYRLWLISSGGFSTEALEVLESRNSFGSNRKQVQLLSDRITCGAKQEPGDAFEYEITIPMTDENELVSANAVEEIAKRHNFEPRTINQIKTALIEACINAAEHGASPDGKIHQKVVIDDRRIEIIVSNRGVRLRDIVPQKARQNDERRGWGLKLMETLMDEVRIEDVDDGTRISMVKYAAGTTEK